MVFTSNSYLARSTKELDIFKAINIVNERMVRPLNAVLRAMSSSRDLTVTDSRDLRRVPDTIASLSATLYSSITIRDNQPFMAPLQHAETNRACLREDLLHNRHRGWKGLANTPAHDRIAREDIHNPMKLSAEDSVRIWLGVQRAFGFIPSMDVVGMVSNCLNRNKKP